ncbi:MAG TPA: isocitrate/isopropylmalate family dehydrogenase, partial [Jatrophihabitans sp.]|nr:isocitrate/isopropylmalate family dehydrogenase [Jatrophihabitans sp.]
MAALEVSVQGADSARIAVIAGDGVGPEVTAVAEAVLTQATKDSGLSVTLDHFGWGSEHYLAHGRAMPSDAAETLRAYDAVLFGSFGTPELP